MGGIVLDSWVVEAEAHLNATVERGEYIRKRHGRAEQAKENTETLLQKVTTNKLNDTTFDYINKVTSVPL